MTSTTLIHRLTAIAAVGFCIAVTLLLGFAFWASSTVDQKEVARQTGFVATGLRQILDRVPKEQESVTLWDDSVAQAKANNQPWMVENLGKWVGDYFGHDEVYVLDSADRPIHAMRQGVTVDVGEFTSRQGLVLPLARKLRAEMAEVSQGLSDSSQTVGSMGERDILMVDEIPTEISVKPIVASTTAVVVAPGSEYLHVSFRRVANSLISEIERTYGIDELRLEALSDGGPAPSVPVADANGRYLGFLTWKPSLPGHQLLQQALPGTIAAIAVGGGLLILLLRRLTISARELAASEARTRFLAFHDTLTGLPNRAFFEECLERALAEASRSDTFVALHLLDIDRFKHINDTRGHAAGDDVIRGAALRFGKSISPGDTVARLGGDVLAIIQTGILTSSAAQELAN